MTELKRILTDLIKQLLLKKMPESTPYATIPVLL